MAFPLPVCLVGPLVLFPLIGYALFETRDDDQHVKHHPAMFIIKFVFMGVGLVSEPLALYVFLVEGDALPIAMIIIWARLNHVLVSAMFIRSLFMDETEEERCCYLPGLSAQLDWNCFEYHGALYRFLLFLGTMEVTSFLYLPWRSTKFSDDPRSGSTPSFRVFSYIFYVKAFQAVVGVVTQAVWLAYSANIKPPVQVAVVCFNFSLSLILLGMRLNQGRHFRHNENNCELHQGGLAKAGNMVQEGQAVVVDGASQKKGGELRYENPLYHGSGSRSSGIVSEA
jgi:hypothetical protein